MRHESALDLLPLFSLHALEEADAHAVDQHVSRCPVCRAELEGYTAVTAALSGELEPGPDIWSKILARIDAG